jgi:hypothetical protein
MTKRNHKQKKQKSSNTGNPVYRGPILVPNATVDKIHRVSLVYSTPTVLSGGPSYNIQIPSSGVTSAIGWSLYVATYREARVVAAKLKYVPVFGSSSAGGVGEGVVVAHNFNSSPTLTTFPNDWVAFPHHQIVTVGKPFSIDLRAQGLEDLSFQPTATYSISMGGFALAFENCAIASVILGRFYVYFTVEFKNRVL